MPYGKSHKVLNYSVVFITGLGVSIWLWWYINQLNAEWPVLIPWALCMMFGFLWRLSIRKDNAKPKNKKIKRYV